MGNYKVPDHRLEGLGVGSHGGRIRNTNQEAGIFNLSCESSIAADHASDCGSYLAAVLQSTHQVHTHVAISIAPTHGKDYHHIGWRETATPKPVGIGGIPSLIVDSRRQLRNVITGAVGLYSADLAKIADCM